MTDWAAAYRPWEPIECAPIPVPWARRMGVPVSHVQLPGPVAAATAEAVIITAQAIACVRVCMARDALDRYRRAQAQSTLAGQFQAAQARRYDPPLARMVCPVCGDAADAWINDDGTLQDPRDVLCAREHDPAVMIQVRDGTA